MAVRNAVAEELDTAWDSGRGDSLTAVEGGYKMTIDGFEYTVTVVEAAE